jgi:hypothetical protein
LKIEWYFLIFLYLLKIYKCKVVRENEFDSHDVYRSYDDFCDLYKFLIKEFPALKLQKTIPYSRFKENFKPVAQRINISSLISELLSLNSEIRNVSVN